MSRYDFDLFVIGGGSGGVRGARRAAEAGARVALAESGPLGGTCVNVGCVPKKLLVYASHFTDECRDARGFGWTVDTPRFDWPTLIRNKDREIQRLNGVYDNLLNASGVRVMRGRATFVDPHTVAVGNERFTSAYVLVATGGRPYVPDVPGRELAITSDEAFYLPDLPEKVVIVGGGYIAVEFAGIFHGMGAAVTQLYRGERILRGFDDDLRTHLADSMRRNGIDLRFNTDILAIERAGDRLIARLSDGASVPADRVMFATGRVPLADELSLPDAGVAINSRGAIVVDEFSRTSVHHIYAVGDVTDRMNLTPVAIAEAEAFVCTVFRDAPTAMDYADIPTAVFSHPPLATVGLTEAEARERFGEVDVYRSGFRPLKNTLGGGEGRTLVKLIVDRDTGRVLGAHMIGDDAAEIIQGIAIALKCGANKQQFDATIGIHPTSAEEWVTLRS